MIITGITKYIFINICLYNTVLLYNSYYKKIRLKVIIIHLYIRYLREILKLYTAAEESADDIIEIIDDNKIPL